MADIYEKDYKSHQYRVKQLKASIDMIINNLVDDYNHKISIPASDFTISKDDMKQAHGLSKEDIANIAKAGMEIELEEKISRLRYIKNEIDSFQNEFIIPILKEFEKAKKDFI